jgi:ribosomal protein S18 acetylase RimI-like enzyme
MYADEPEAQVRAIRKRAQFPTDDDVSLVAKYGEKIVGFIRLKIGIDSVELVSMYVEPDYFNQGIGTKLWLEAIQKLPKEKQITVEVATYTKAIDFYKKIGFSDTGERSVTEKMLRSGNSIPLMKMVYFSR